MHRADTLVPHPQTASAAAGTRLNRFEQLKVGLDPSDLTRQLDDWAEAGVEPGDDEAQRLRLLGIARRDRTPGFYMIRVRIPGGRLTSHQARVLGQIAKGLGRDTLDITSRAQIQLRWLRLEQLPEVREALLACGLETSQTLMDSVRNIRGCPLAGLSPHELFDATPAILAIEKRLVGLAARDDSTNLPRKLNVAVTGCRCGCCDAEVQDLSLVPAMRDGHAGFNVLAGGKISGGDVHIARPLDVFVSPAEAPDLVAAVVTLYRDFGPRQTRSRCRLVHMLEALGVAAFRGALERRLGRDLTRGGKTLLDPTLPICGTPGTAATSDAKQAVGLLVPVGRLAGNELAELAHFADRFGDGGLRLTAGQNVILTGVRRGLRELLAQPLLQTRLTARPHPIIAGTIVCTGIDYCSMAVIETKARAAEVARELARRLPECGPVRLGWSGCRAGCGQHATADIGLVGRKAQTPAGPVEAVDVYVGGSPATDAEGTPATGAVKLFDAVPVAKLVDVLEPLVRFGSFATFRRQWQQHLAQHSADTPTPTAPPAPAGTPGGNVVIQSLRVRGKELALTKR